MKKAVLFSFYFLRFAAGAAFRPYLVLFYQSLQFTGAQIGLLVGVAPMLTIFTLPLMTGFADTTNRHRFVMNLSLLFVIATLIILPFLQSFALVMIFITLSVVLFAPIQPLSASAAMYMLGDRKDLFGRIRLGGTLGFSIAATVVGALVQSNGLRFAFWSAAVLFFIGFLISQKFEHGGAETRKTTNWKQARDLLKNSHFIMFLLIGLTGGISFSTLNTYLFPYMKELGAGESTMGLALTIGTISEVPILFFLNHFLKRFEAYTVLVFSVGMTAVRFLLLAFAPTAGAVLFIQLLNGFNHPLLTVAGVTYADEQAPDGFRATAQGLFNVAVGGIGSAIGGFVGGVLFDSIGAKGMHFVFGIFLVVVLVVVTVMQYILPTKPKGIPATKDE